MNKLRISKEQALMIGRNPLSFATVDDKSNPHVIIVAYVKVKDNRLIITDNYMVRTIENIKNNSNVSLALYNKKWKGLYIKGVARYYKDGEYFKFVKGLKENKREPCKGVIVVTPKSIREMF